MVVARFALLVFLSVAGACSTAGAVDLGPVDQERLIPVKDATGKVVDLHGRFCRPAGDQPGRLVVINHGSPPDSADRPAEKLGRCGSEAARWFLSRGYVVAFALRRGYGATGGDWAEGFGSCAKPDFVKAGRETARDIGAVIDYAQTLPFVRSEGVVVVGQSAGGWGTIAYDAGPHPLAVAFVNMAGGRGGHHKGKANSLCNADKLVEAAGVFGKTATTPMLWVYAANDSFFSPAVARDLHKSFTAAGGKAALEAAPAYDGDGHDLFLGKGGSAVWGPLVEKYLAKQLARKG